MQTARTGEVSVRCGGTWVGALPGSGVPLADSFGCGTVEVTRSLVIWFGFLDRGFLDGPKGRVGPLCLKKECDSLNDHWIVRRDILFFRRISIKVVKLDGCVEAFESNAFPA